MIVKASEFLTCKNRWTKEPQTQEPGTQELKDKDLRNTGTVERRRMRICFGPRICCGPEIDGMLEAWITAERGPGIFHGLSTNNILGTDDTLNALAVERRSGRTNI